MDTELPNNLRKDVIKS